MVALYTTRSVRLGYFWKVDPTKSLATIATIFGIFSGYFKKHKFLTKKTGLVTIWATLGEIRQLYINQSGHTKFTSCFITLGTYLPVSTDL